MGDESDTEEEHSDRLQRVMRTFRSITFSTTKLNNYIKRGLSFKETTRANNVTAPDSFNSAHRQLPSVSRRRSSSFHFSHRQSLISPPVGSLLSYEQMVAIYGWLPTRVRIRKPLLVFSTAVDGTSLINFYEECDHFEPTLIIVKTYGAPSHIFGAYCSTAWENRTSQHGKEKSYFGTGECFLFQLSTGGGEAIKYPWVGEGSDEPTGRLPHMFQLGTEHHLQIGGGGGTGLCLLNPLTSGYSEHCETFNNAPLAEPGQRDFECHTVEVYGFN